VNTGVASCLQTFALNLTDKGQHFAAGKVRPGMWVYGLQTVVNCIKGQLKHEFRIPTSKTLGDRGGTVAKVLCYISEGRWFDPSWSQWNFH